MIEDEKSHENGLSETGVQPGTCEPMSRAPLLRPNFETTLKQLPDLPSANTSLANSCCMLCAFLPFL